MAPGDGSVRQLNGKKHFQPVDYQKAGRKPYAEPVQGENFRLFFLAETPLNLALFDRESTARLPRAEKGARPRSLDEWRSGDPFLCFGIAPWLSLPSGGEHRMRSRPRPNHNLPMRTIMFCAFVNSIVVFKFVVANARGEQAAGFFKHFSAGNLHDGTLNLPRPGRVIVGLLCIAITTAMGPLAFGDVIRIVSPPSAADIEGNSLVTPSKGPIRIEFLVPASDFAGLPASHRYIASFNFRADRRHTESFDYIIPHEQVWMSTTSVQSLTTGFDANHGPDKKMVFDGTMTYPLSGTGPDAGPRPFTDGTRLQSPFYYDPSKGNLLIELRDFDKNFPIQASLDVVNILSANIRTLVSDNPNGAIGIQSPNNATILQFEFVVPEPSTFGMACLLFIFHFVRPCNLRRTRDGL